MVLNKLVSFLLCLSLGFLSLTNCAAEFFDCISTKLSSNFTLTDILITPNDTSYSTVLQSTIQNLRYSTHTTSKPLAIITPLSYSHVQATVICSVASGLQIRIRSGGHDHEGLSYTSHDHTPFVLLDLNKLRSVTVNLDDNTAWVESGATIGELYYWVSEKSNNTLGFPAGESPSVGVGGHLSGGGFGKMARKYGLSADNVIDAHIVDVNGRLLDRSSMGEDLFWAIRGGGGGSFGIVVSWKINLVYVPPKVTVFTLSKKLDRDATNLVNKWQYIAHNVTQDLFIDLVIIALPAPEENDRTLLLMINGLFLGTADKLIEIVEDRFPELGLGKTDCIEMTWIESVVYFSGYLVGETIDALKERRPWPKSYAKGKSDYVQTPIPEEAFEDIWKWCLQENLLIVIQPHGGRMSEIDATEIPYPHREGNLYTIQYFTLWTDDDSKASEKHVDVIREIYEKMTPFVSKNPRQAYVNVRDLDIGRNGIITSYEQASEWGSKFFMGNFRRLALVKGEVDPTNFFGHEQSIPPLVLPYSY